VIELRAAEAVDVPAVAGLLEEMDRFYGSVEFPPIELRQRQIKGLLFGPVPAARVLLAFDGTDLVGLATYSSLWPAAGVTQSLYLKELYVRESHRKRGVGRLLMARLCAVAIETGCSRVEWTTDRDNEAAQDFYERLGTVVNPGKIMYRVDGDDIARLAEHTSRS